jgi:hypothetical protein
MRTAPATDQSADGSKRVIGEVAGPDEIPENCGQGDVVHDTARGPYDIAQLAEKEGAATRERIQHGLVSLA